MMHKHLIIPFVQIDPSFASVSGIARRLRRLSAFYADSVRGFLTPWSSGSGTR